ncbi:hypothetical protein NDU88_001123 [Pleurodeles waltl]|uniref:Uncharacterized protein n=1 Tax=Pleurodeles waltl TaxID=8319 RepID=A0AAV7U5H7_PLEWA|nr:hypothetical protein NDU88_001123 [Pleurodeles waltl]
MNKHNRDPEDNVVDTAVRGSCKPHPDCPVDLQAVTPRGFAGEVPTGTRGEECGLMGKGRDKAVAHA